MKVSPNAPCPCGSGGKLKKCCGLIHRGRPAGAHRIMRARFTAYAIGNVDFLIATTHPQSPHFQADRKWWRRDLADYCRVARFSDLVVLEHTVEGGQAWVAFTASVERDGGVIEHAERSLFEQVDGRWLYVRGV